MLLEFYLFSWVNYQCDIVIILICLYSQVTLNFDEIGIKSEILYLIEELDNCVALLNLKVYFMLYYDIYHEIINLGYLLYLIVLVNFLCN